MESMTVGGLLTIGQLAERLQLSAGTIYYWVSRKEIPVIRIGKHLRFDFEAVLVHFKDLSGLSERSSGLGFREVVKYRGRSLTTQDPDHAESRRKD
jgi:excisionase family DNA binding protein